MHQFVPLNADGGVQTILYLGDGMTCERQAYMNARRHRAGSELIPQGRLLGLEPVPGEFHKRGIYLQVRKRILFNFLFLSQVPEILPRKEQYSYLLDQ
jgi:hypothetical protein